MSYCPWVGDMKYFRMKILLRETYHILQILLKTSKLSKPNFCPAGCDFKPKAGNPRNDQESAKNKLNIDRLLFARFGRMVKMKCQQNCQRSEDGAAAAAWQGCCGAARHLTPGHLTPDI